MLASYARGGRGDICSTLRANALLLGREAILQTSVRRFAEASLLVPGNGNSPHRALCSPRDIASPSLGSPCRVRGPLIRSSARAGSRCSWRPPRQTPRPARRCRRWGSDGGPAPLGSAPAPHAAPWRAPLPGQTLAASAWPNSHWPPTRLGSALLSQMRVQKPSSAAKVAASASEQTEMDSKSIRA